MRTKEVFRNNILCFSIWENSMASTIRVYAPKNCILMCLTLVFSRFFRVSSHNFNLTNKSKRWHITKSSLNLFTHCLSFTLHLASLNYYFTQFCCCFSQRDFFRSVYSLFLFLHCSDSLLYFTYRFSARTLLAMLQNGMRNCELFYFWWNFWRKKMLQFVVCGFSSSCIQSNIFQCLLLSPFFFFLNFLCHLSN